MEAGPFLVERVDAIHEEHVQVDDFEDPETGARVREPPPKSPWQPGEWRRWFNYRPGQLELFEEQAQRTAHYQALDAAALGRRDDDA